LNRCVLGIDEQEKATPVTSVVTEIAPDGTVRYFDTSLVRPPSDPCTWADNFASVGHPYINHMPPRFTLVDVEAAKARGENLFGGATVSRLDLLESECMVRGLLTHLESDVAALFFRDECR
jgi:hypothetical protein